MVKYLRYVLKNIEPIRITDDSASQFGQEATLWYIPGSTIRGVVMKALAQDKDFEEIKSSLFSSAIRYLNAYICKGERELFPSPKGFYEDKSVPEGKKKLQNVIVDGSFDEGLKRAALGRYSYIEGDTIYYYGVDTRSDLKIKINVPDKKEQNVFRNEYLTDGNIFTGYIAVEKPELEERIKNAFGKNVVIGNARSAGFGKCEVLSADYVDRIPFDNLLPRTDAKKSCYMMLLSNMAMQNEDGELCGLDLYELGKLMGVENLAVKYCSTSTVNVKGYNRTWGIHVPSAVMYEQGSIFHFEYEGILTAEKMKQIAHSGIGIRKNEGCGRVIFIDQYEQVTYKEKGADGEKESDGKAAQGGTIRENKEDDEVLRNVARNYYRNLLHQKIRKYVVEHPIEKGTLRNSQLGKLLAFTIAYKYNPAEGRKEIDKYFAHAKGKEDERKVQKSKSSIKALSRFVNEIFQTEIDTLLAIEKKDTIMGIEKKELLSLEDIYKIKMKLLAELIRYDNKKGER